MLAAVSSGHHSKVTESEQISMPPSVNFLHLRTEVLADLFTVWLKLDAVARVDSAICKKSDRSIWLALLASSRCKFNLTSRAGFNNDLSKWQVPRKLCFRKVVLAGHVLEERCASPTDGIDTGGNTLSNCLKHMCSHITLELHNCALNDVLWEEVLSACPNLTNLQIFATAEKCYTNATKPILPKVTRLYIAMHYFTATQLVAFVQRFPALTHLHISGNFFDNYLELTESCPLLTHLCLLDSCITGPHFVKLLQQLKQGLKCLVLPHRHRFHPEVLFQLSQHILTLRCLHMTEKFCAPDDTSTVANALNKCTFVNTFYVHASVVVSGELRMSSVTTLHLEHCTQLALDNISTSFPSITALGMLSTPMADEKFLTSITNGLLWNRKIRTVYVLKELHVRLRALLQHQGVLVRKNVYFDVSSYDADCC